MIYLSAWGSFYWVVPTVIISVFAVMFLENKKYRKPVLYLMIGIWGSALIYLLFIYRLPGNKDTGFSYNLFKIYRKAGGIGWEANQAVRQILFNILLYVPIGCVLGSLTKKTGIVVVIGIGISIFTELLQGLTGLGWADVDDVVNNSIGLTMGIAIFHISEKIVRRRGRANEKSDSSRR